MKLVLKITLSILLTGMITELARWKLKHFKAQYGREVVLVRMR